MLQNLSGIESHLQQWCAEVVSPHSISLVNVCNMNRKIGCSKHSKVYRHQTLQEEYRAW